MQRIFSTKHPRFPLLEKTIQGGQVDDFIAQIGNFGDILDLWAIKVVNKNAKKAQILNFGRYFFPQLM